MTEKRHWPQDLELPDDLRNWAQAERLLTWALEAAAAVVENSPGAPACLPPGPPRLWLSVLTYSYAIGLLPSEEIQLHAGLDPQLRYLSGRRGAPAIQLRQFRRRHRRLIERSLGQLLRCAWESHVDRSSLEVHPWDLEERLRIEAERRIDRAVLMDTMALDD